MSRKNESTIPEAATVAPSPAPSPASERAARFASFKLGAIFIVLEEGDYIEGKFVRVGQCEMGEDPLTGDVKKEVTYIVDLARAEWADPQFKDGKDKPTIGEIEFLGVRELKRQLRPVMPGQKVAIQRLAARAIEGSERDVIDYRVGLGPEPAEGYGRTRARKSAR